MLFRSLIYFILLCTQNLLAIPAVKFTAVCHGNLFPMGAQEKLLNAAKARVRRMVQEKSKRTDLAAPEFIKLEWEKGTAARTQMALCLQEVNWSKEWLNCENSIK
mgnify:CR=1 FL=1